VPDAKQACDILNTALATELVCVLRYTYHASSPPDPQRIGEGGFLSTQRRGHHDIAERISQLGGKPESTGGA